MMDLCVVVLCLVVSGLLDDGAWSAMEVEPSALLLLFFSGDGRVRRFLFSGFLL